MSRRTMGIPRNQEGRYLRDPDPPDGDGEEFMEEPDEDEEEEEGEYNGYSTKFTDIDAEGTTHEKRAMLVEIRLRLMYPFLDRKKFPIPLSWVPDECHAHVRPTHCGLRLSYHRRADMPSHDQLDERTNRLAGSAKTQVPIPASCGIYYFEMHVLNAVRGHMAIGICDKDCNLGQLPGWERNSYGYHGDDGHYFSHNSNINGTTYGPKYTTGDIIGCGLNFIKKAVFFTKNGEHLGYGPELDRIDGFFPTVGLQQKGQVVDMNFGQIKFRFDIRGEVHRQRLEVGDKMMNIRIPQPDTKEWCKRLLVSCLVGEGYGKTLEVLVNKYRFTTPIDIEKIKTRREIIQMILRRQHHLALNKISDVYKGLLDKPKYAPLQIKLKCLYFTEMAYDCALMREEERERRRMEAEMDLEEALLEAEENALKHFEKKLRDKEKKAENGGETEEVVDSHGLTVEDYKNGRCVLILPRKGIGRIPAAKTNNSVTVPMKLQTRNPHKRVHSTADGDSIDNDAPPLRKTPPSAEDLLAQEIQEVNEMQMAALYDNDEPCSSQMAADRTAARVAIVAKQTRNKRNGKRKREIKEKAEKEEAEDGIDGQEDNGEHHDGENGREEHDDNQVKGEENGEMNGDGKFVLEEGQAYIKCLNAPKGKIYYFRPAFEEVKDENGFVYKRPYIHEKLKEEYIKDVTKWTSPYADEFDKQRTRKLIEYGRKLYAQAKTVYEADKKRLKIVRKALATLSFSRVEDFDKHEFLSSRIRTILADELNQAMMESDGLPPIYEFRKLLNDYNDKHKELLSNRLPHGAFAGFGMIGFRRHLRIVGKMDSPEEFEDLNEGDKSERIREKELIRLFEMERQQDDEENSKKEDEQMESLSLSNNGEAESAVPSQPAS